MLKEAYYNKVNIDAESSLISEEIRKINSRTKNWTASSGKTALLVADMQQYFTNASSHAFVPSSKGIIPKISSLIECFITTGNPVIFSQHHNDEQEGMMAAWWRNLINSQSEDFLLCNELQSSKASLVIRKKEYDAFHQTRLDDFLKSHKIKNLIITGVMTNLCCESTARSGFVKGYRVCIPVDATAAYNRQFHLSSFINLSFGFMPLATSSDIIKSMTGGK